MLELQRTVGNRAVQRLIMHGEYEATKVSPSPQSIRDELETKETIDSLQKSSGQDTDAWLGSKALDHPDNYVIDHGLGGRPAWYDMNAVTTNFVTTRGIRPGDVIHQITCGIGKPGGDGDLLAKLLGAAGVEGVKPLGATARARARDPLRAGRAAASQEG